MWCETFGQIHVTQDMAQWRSLVNKIMKFDIKKKESSEYPTELFLAAQRKES
jgi:hypothetical protein